jgi:hypothetical protein
MDSLNSFKIPFLDLSSMSGYSILLYVFVLLTMLTIFMKNKIKNYFSKREKLIKMSEDYERRRQCRNDLRVKFIYKIKYHFDWAIDRGESESAKNIGKEILRIDKELREMYQDYQYLKQKGTYPLKKI